MTVDSSVEEGKLLDAVRAGVPLVERPFEAIGAQVGLDEADVIGRIAALKEARVIRRIGAIFDGRRLGYRSSLVAMRVPEAREDRVASVLDGHPGISHIQRRNHAFSIWFTIAVPPTSKLGLERTVEILDREAQADSTRILPALRLYKVGVKLDASGQSPPVDGAAEAPVAARASREAGEVTPELIGLVRELQKDLPLVPAPYTELAERLGWSLDRFLAVGRRMVEEGQLLRVAALVHHRAAEAGASAMGVWAVPEERIDRVGEAMADYDAVSHCYRRPVAPDWPYSLFTMVHGRTVAECEAALESMSKATGIAEYEALYSTREYRRARPYYFPPELEAWEAEALVREAEAGGAGE